MPTFHKSALVGLTVLLAAMTSVAGAQASTGTRVTKDVTDSGAVAEVVHRFHGALASGDSATAIALLAPHATILESGSAETVAEYRGHHLPADIEFARAVPGTRSPARVTVNGNAAWATSTSVTQGTYKERAINSAGAELMVLERFAGSWRIVAIHWSSRRRAS